MARKFAADELVDAHGVAEILGLSAKTARGSVSVYRARYDDFPAPVIDLGHGRCRLWLRHDIETWARRRAQR